MKTKGTPRQNALTRLVDRGFALSQQISVLNGEFKQIKERLKEEASARPAEHLPLLDKDSAGFQWIVSGTACECRIVFPESKLKTNLDPSENEFLAIRDLAGDHFKSLFKKVTVFRPTKRKTFRNRVIKLLAPKRAADLLSLCTSESEPKAVWKAQLSTAKERK